jgi:hypothetical protein
LAPSTTPTHVDSTSEDVGTTTPASVRAAQVSLLAATAIGLAFVAGEVDGDIATLADLAGSDRSVLAEASTAVFALEVVSGRTRRAASQLLRRAASLRR